MVWDADDRTVKQKASERSNERCGRTRVLTTSPAPDPTRVHGRERACVCAIETEKEREKGKKVIYVGPVATQLEEHRPHPHARRDHHAPELEAVPQPGIDSD